MYIFISVNPLAEETMTPYQYASNDPNIIEADRYVYWEDNLWIKSPISPHNGHKVKVYRHQRDSIKNENRKDSIRAIKLR